jgi:hypothetical protein
MGQSDVQNLLGVHLQQIATEGVQSDHVFAGVYLFRTDNFSGAKGPPFRQDGSWWKTQEMKG